jgi:hypothetical protein
MFNITGDLIQATSFDQISSSLKEHSPSVKHVVNQE